MRLAIYGNSVYIIITARVIQCHIVTHDIGWKERGSRVCSVRETALVELRRGDVVNFPTLCVLLIFSDEIDVIAMLSDLVNQAFN